jgi:cell division protein ZapA (FtsZ GTPase activity inhibitor)
MDNSKDDKSLSVDIAGEVINIYADEGPEHIARIAEYINNIVNNFNAKKGPGVRKSVQLTFAALEICNTLFAERENKMTDSERNYEKMYHIEVQNHKRTQERLDETLKELEEYIRTFDTPKP